MRSPKRVQPTPPAAPVSAAEPRAGRARRVLTGLLATVLVVVGGLWFAANRAFGLERPTDLVDERITYESHDGLLLAVPHSPGRTSMGVGFVGQVRLEGGCWWFGKSLVAWPKDTRWADAAHTRVVLGDGVVIGDGTDVDRIPGHAAGGFTLSPSVHVDAPCSVPAGTTVVDMSLDPVPNR